MYSTKELTVRFGLRTHSLDCDSLIYRTGFAVVNLEEPSGLLP